MTAHRRGHLLRAAVVGALVSGAVLLPAAPALADVTAQPGALTLKPGEEKTINITLSDLNPGQNPQANVSVNGLGNDVTVRGPGGCQQNNGGLRCAQNAFDRDGDNFKLALSVSHKAQTSVQQGQTKDGSINIDAGGGNGDDSVNVTLQGPAQAASVTEVTGKVTDQSTGNGVSGAQVLLKDSTGKTFDATANSQGNYSIKPSNNNPIAAGQITVTVSKEGFADATTTGNGQAGKALAMPAVRMKPTAASAEPSAPVASDTGAPTEEASGAPADQATPQNASNEGEGPSKLSWILIGMGVLLVLLGIGAIVLLVMRRKDDSEGDDPDGYGTNPQMAPAGAGVYDRTMVGGGRSNANDQTAIVGPQQQLDEFPDPYAAPPAAAPTRVGGAYGDGYDDTRAANGAPGYGGGDYGNGGGYRDERGYGAQQGGYNDEPRGGGYGGGGGGYADQATGVYQGNGANGSEYGANGNGYGGGGANGYGGGAGGGANGYGGGGYGQANGGGANGYGPDGYEGEYGGRGGNDYEGEYGRRGGGDYQR